MNAWECNNNSNCVTYMRQKGWHYQSSEESILLLRTWSILHNALVATRWCKRGVVIRCASGTQRCACRGWRTRVLHLNQREYDDVSNCSHFRVIFLFFYDGDSWRKLRHWNLQWALFSGFNTQHFCKQKLLAPHMKKLLIKGVERSRISVSGRIISISMLQFSADILDRQRVVKTNKQPKKKKTDDILFRQTFSKMAASI